MLPLNRSPPWDHGFTDWSVYGFISGIPLSLRRVPVFQLWSLGQNQEACMQILANLHHTSNAHSPARITGSAFSSAVIPSTFI